MTTDRIRRLNWTRQSPGAYKATAAGEEYAIDRIKVPRRAPRWWAFAPDGRNCICDTKAEAQQWAWDEFCRRAHRRQALADRAARKQAMRQVYRRCIIREEGKIGVGTPGMRSLYQAEVQFTVDDGKRWESLASRGGLTLKEAQDWAALHFVKSDDIKAL